MAIKVLSGLEQLHMALLRVPSNIRADTRALSGWLNGHAANHSCAAEIMGNLEREVSPFHSCVRSGMLDKGLY